MVETALTTSLRQEGAGVRFDWGPTGARELVHGAGAAVVVDTLSFTTAVAVATGRAMAVVPYPMGSDGAAELASRMDAALAVARRDVSPDHPFSLSPRSILDAPFTGRLVLPSPNGSAIAASVASEWAGADRAPTDARSLLAGCLRNAAATVGWLLARDYGTAERPVWLIGAGERWPDRSLRPALEDLLAAGAVARGMERSGCRLSPEAQSAAAAFASTSDLVAAIRGSASGRELEAMGFPDEARIAAALDADDHVSVMEDGMFVRG
jgi:2-phosphosulfolactate phosphatase